MAFGGGGPFLFLAPQPKKIEDLLKKDSEIKQSVNEIKKKFL